MFTKKRLLLSKTTTSFFIYIFSFPFTYSLGKLKMVLSNFGLSSILSALITIPV